jgi:hypothetical protein
MVGSQERDETVQRLQTAFVEGRLNGEEFDVRGFALMGGVEVRTRKPKRRA